MPNKQEARQGIQIKRSNPNGVIPQFVNDITAVGSGEEFYLTFFVAEPPQPTNPGIQVYSQFESVVVSKLIMAPSFLYGMLILILNILSHPETLKGKKLPPNLIEVMTRIIKEQGAKEGDEK